MKTIRDTQKKYCSRAMVFSIFVSLGVILLGGDAIGKGLILGAIFSCINFVLIGETLPGRIVEGEKKAFFRSLGSIFFRYILLAAPIICSIRYEKFNFFATAAGLFAVQLTILFDQFIKLLPVKGKEHI